MNHPSRFRQPHILLCALFRLAEHCLAVFCLAVLYGCAGPAEAPATEQVVVLVQETPAAEQPRQPSVTPRAVYALSGGQEIQVPPGQCMDLDSGSLLDLNDPRCDFAFLPPETEPVETLRFQPLSFAVFDFRNVFWDLPESGACSLLASYGSASQRIKPEGGYYVCYQTGAGYWGVLNVKSMSGRNMVMYWITFPQQAELISTQQAYYPGLEPTATPPSTASPKPETVLNRGTNIWVPVDYGLDVDTGAVQFGWIQSNDLMITAGQIGEDGRLLSLRLEPFGSSAIGGEGYENAPRSADCKTTASYQTEPLDITRLYRYHCVQTGDGRLGYIFVHELHPGVGARVDWVSWPDTAALVTQPAASPTAIESGAAMTVGLPPQRNGVKVYSPGAKISFTWQLANTGKVTWNTRYSIQLAGGTGLGGEEHKWIPYPITNGMTIRLAFMLTAPAEPGTYIAEYWLVDDSGRRFGIGPNGSRPLQLIINSGQPGITRAEGQSVTLAPGACFDLDLGYPGVDDPACDFTVSVSQDPHMLLITSAQTAFDFDEPFSRPPSLGQCTVGHLSSGRRVVDFHNWYVCFRTAEGRYGWLKILDAEPHGLLFDWKIYQ